MKQASENENKHLEVITDSGIRFRNPIQVRNKILRYADKIAYIQSQFLYDLDAEDVITRVKDEIDGNRYEYGVLVNKSDIPIAVTALKVRYQSFSENPRDNWDYVVPQQEEEDIVYSLKKLNGIIRFEYPCGEMTGLCRDNKYRGMGLGGRLSDMFSDYLLQEKNQQRLGYENLMIFRVTKGLYSQNNDLYQGVIQDMLSNDGLTQEELEARGVPGLPHVHPASKKAAQAALRQGFIPVCASSKNGGPLWVEEGKGESIKDFVLLGEKDGYSSL